ncbi:MAG: phosphoribosyltransferase family protein [Patescibacteria group bacterium]
MQTDKSLKEICGIILNAILPLNPTQKKIEKMTAETLLSLPIKNSPPPLKNTFSFLSYQNELVRQSIWSLKFKNNRKIAKIFAKIIYDNLIEELADLKLTHNFDNPLLIPIPISHKKLQERGYNQTELIAQELNNLDKRLSFEYRKNILKKIKHTTPQSRTHSKEEREINLKNCFKVIMPKLIKDKNIILLDDVITTGATLKEAMRTLKKYKPKQIICVTVAH